MSLVRWVGCAGLGMVLASGCAGGSFGSLNLGEEVTGNVRAPGGTLRSLNDAPLRGANVESGTVDETGGKFTPFSESGAARTSNSAGYYRLMLPAGTRFNPTLMVRAGGMRNFVTSNTVDLNPDTTAACDVLLAHLKAADPPLLLGDCTVTDLKQFITLARQACANTPAATDVAAAVANSTAAIEAAPACQEKLKAILARAGSKKPATAT